jgi:hypothetical protein
MAAGELGFLLVMLLAGTDSLQTKKPANPEFFS